MQPDSEKYCGSIAENLQQCGVFVPAQYLEGIAQSARSVEEATFTRTFRMESAGPAEVVPLLQDLLEKDKRASVHLSIY